MIKAYAFTGCGVKSPVLLKIWIFIPPSKPVSVIDLELTMTNLDAIRTRIGAFCEILEN